MCVCGHARAEDWVQDNERGNGVNEERLPLFACWCCFSVEPERMTGIEVACYDCVELRGKSELHACAEWLKLSGSEGGVRVQEAKQEGLLVMARELKEVKHGWLVVMIKRKISAIREGDVRESEDEHARAI